MFVSNALVGLREGLEASLVVVILLAFLRRTGRQAAIRWVWLGVGAAAALSIGLGAVLTFGTRQLSFEAQEMIGGFGSILAVAFVTGMVFWMRRVARTIAGELHGRLDRALEVGPWAVAAVGFLGVGREGLESALFFYATTQAAGAGTLAPVLGWVVGLSAAVLLGWAIHRGALRLNLGTFFRWTALALVIVAAGVLSYGIHDLQEAAVLPGLTALAFDVTHVIDPGSVTGTLLKGLFGFTPQTTWLQLAAWATYLIVVLGLYFRPVRTTAQPAPRVPAAA